MIKIMLAFAVGLALTGPAQARGFHHPVHHSAANIGGEEGFYVNRAGHSVHRPMHSTRAPQGASARCGDGTWSFSENHRGTCSHHGGVDRWL